MLTPVDSMRAGFYGKKARTPVQQTFTSSTTWYPPATTTKVDVTARGQNGNPAPVLTASAAGATVYWINSGSGGTSGNYGWAAATSAANAAKNAINAGGNPAYTFYNIAQYANGTRNVTTASRSESGVIANSASLSYEAGWQLSGNITGGASDQSWSAIVSWNYYGTQSPGADTTAFGYTFAGSMYPTAAVTQTRSDVPVTAGTGYPITVAPGGSVTLNYYQ